MANQVLTLQAETSKTADGSTPSQDCLNYKEIAIELNITNVSGTSPTLDMTIEHSHDNVNWSTLYAFPQKTGVGISTRYVPNDTEFGFMRYVRANYVLGGSNPNFTFSVTIVGKE